MTIVKTIPVQKKLYIYDFNGQNKMSDIIMF